MLDEPPSWARRRKGTADIRAARHYSGFIRALRITLPVLVILGMGVLFLWPAFQPQPTIDLPRELPKATMAAPEFSGTTEQNDAYIIRAQEAQQLQGQMGVVDLTAPSGELTQKSGDILSLQALRGRYDQPQKRLWLGGDVTIRRVSPQGQEQVFSSDELMVALDKQVVWSDKPARFSGAFGQVEGQGIQVFNNGDYVRFKGPARAVLVSSKVAQAKKPGTRN